jgi:hypothetical protein
MLIGQFLFMDTLIRHFHEVFALILTLCGIILIAIDITYSVLSYAPSLKNLFLLILQSFVDPFCPAIAVRKGRKSRKNFV